MGCKYLTKASFSPSILVYSSMFVKRFVTTLALSTCVASASIKPRQASGPIVARPNLCKWDLSDPEDAYNA